MATLARHLPRVHIARPRRLSRSGRPKEPPLWLTLVELYSALALIVGLVIGLCFLSAWLTTGSAI